MTITIPNTESLSVNAQFALITDIQNVPTTVTPLAGGGEYVTYGVTAASEAAGERLMAAFMPAIKAAARRTKLKGNEEEAEAVALEAFVRAVREFDLTSDTPFHHTIRPRLERAVMLADREEGSVVTVPAVQVARYFRALHDNGLDPVAAYDACAADPTRWLLSGEAFLAVHSATSRPAYNGGHGDVGDSRPGDSTDVFAAGDQIPSPEDEVLNREYVRWLLDQTTDRQESICRLAYGFADQNTERLRVSKGYREGDVLEDLQVADCLDMARSTVARDRLKALATMRAAAENSLADE